MDHQHTSEIAERIRASIVGSPVMTERDPVHVSNSMGVTQVTPDTPDPEPLMNKVDQTLYRSKQTGRVEHHHGADVAFGRCRKG